MVKNNSVAIPFDLYDFLMGTTHLDGYFFGDTDVNKWRALLADAPEIHSSPSVVSQDLVPVAWMYERPAKLIDVETKVGKYEWPEWMDHGWTKTPLYPASAIEAAQIAARNQAMEEAAKVASDGETLHRRGDSKDWRDGYETACNYIAAAIRALRTPSQHQEEQ